MIRRIAGEHPDGPCASTSRAAPAPPMRRLHHNVL